MKAMANNIIVEKVKNITQKQKASEDSVIKDLVGIADFCENQPEPAESNQRTGIVSAVGPDVKNVKEGDKVLYKNWSADCFTNGGKEYESVDDYGIIAIID